MAEHRVNPSAKNYFIGDQYKCQPKCTMEGFWTDSRISLEPDNGAKLILDWIRSTVDLSGVSTLLDIGCGPSQKVGSFVREFPNIHVTGLDSEEAVALARKYNPAGTYYSCDLDSKGSIEDVLTQLGHFDVIICLDVIEHILYPNNILNLIHKCALPETDIYLATLEREISRGEKSVLEGSQKPDHIREWNAHEFKEYLMHSAFDIVDFKLTPMKSPEQFCQTFRCRVARH